MAKKSLILIIILFTAFITKAQEKYSYINIDKVTYQQFLKGDWDSLITTGKDAIKHGIDFYYLNVRIGVAYFHKKKYLKAIPYLAKAYQIDKKNEYVQEMLYYTYLYAGLEDYSLSVYDYMRLPLKHKVGVKNSALKDMIFSTGINPNLDYKEYLNATYLGQDKSLAYTYLDKTATNFDLGMNFQVSEKLFIYQKLSFYRDDYTLIRQGDDGLDFNMNLMTAQYSDYGRITILPKYNTKIVFNYNLILGNADYLTEDFLYDPVLYRRSTQILVHEDDYTHFTGGVSFQKQWSYFNLKPHVDFFSNGEDFNLYAGLDFTILPLANYNLYFKTSSSYSVLSDEYLPIVISQEVGFSLKRYNFFANYYYGKIHNFVEQDGKFVYNTPESIISLFGGGISVFDKTGKTLKYIAIYPMTYEFEYTNKELTETVIATKLFNKILIKGGIKWKF